MELHGRVLAQRCFGEKSCYCDNNVSGSRCSSSNVTSSSSSSSSTALTVPVAVAVVGAAPKP